MRNRNSGNRGICTRRETGVKTHLPPAALPPLPGGGRGIWERGARGGEGSASRVVLALLVVVIAFAVSGCGKKGDPLPPLRNIPLPTKDLEVRQQGRQILLDMTYPATTVSGMTLGGIDAVELLELVKRVPPAAGESDEPGPLPSAEPREFVAGARTLLTLSGAELTAAVVGDRIQIRLPLAEALPAEPMANIFAVRTVKGDEPSAISNRVTLVPIEPPPPPSNLRATPTAAGIELTWEADDDTDGFDIFRRDAQLRGYGESIRRVDGAQRRYLDKSARFDKRYIYTVRAVAGVEPLIYSDEAGEREVEYEDRFAPPLPKNIVALAERAAIRLRWEASTADDVAGYIIYRREPGRNFHQLTDRPITRNEFLDRGLSSGLTYGYRLRVIDHNGNESELSKPVETTAR